MRVWFRFFLVIAMILLGREGLSSTVEGSVTVRFEIPEDHARAWTAQKKGNITLYSVKENTNQFTRRTKPIVEGHINEIQMAGLESGTFSIPEPGSYRLKWNVDGMAKWTQDFDYNGVDSLEPFTILYNGEGVAVTVYEAKNKGTETAVYRATAVHGEHQDLKLRSMADAKTKAEEERARQEALLEAERTETARRVAIEEEAARQAELRRQREAKQRNDAAIRIQSKVRQTAAAKQVETMKKAKDDATKAAAAEAARLEEERAKRVAEEEAARQAQLALQRVAQARLAEEAARKAADEESARKAEAARQKAEEEAREAARIAALATAALGREVNPEAVDVRVNFEDFRRLGANPTFIFKKYKADGTAGEVILNKVIRAQVTDFRGPDKACELSLRIGADQYVLGIYAPGLPLNYKVESLGGGEVYVMPN